MGVARVQRGTLYGSNQSHVRVADIAHLRSATEHANGQCDVIKRRDDAVLNRAGKPSLRWCASPDLGERGARHDDVVNAPASKTT
jgi:hypothetical protein